MEHVDLEGLLRLRRCSRDFMRLFSEHPCFRQYHLTEDDDRQRYLETARIWATPRAQFDDKVVNNRRGFCDACKKTRRGDLTGKELLKSMTSLYCSVCETMHKEMHFTVAQRLADDSDRMCVGHERSMVVCKDTRITLDQVVAWSQDPELGSMTCKGAHNKAHTRVCGVKGCPGDSQPIFHPYQDEKGCTRLKISYFCHITLERHGTGHICCHCLRSELQASTRDEDIGMSREKFMPLDCPMRRAFDPNTCDCVDWCAPNCSDSPRKMRRLPSLKVATTRLSKRWREAAPRDGYTSGTGRCASKRHGFTLRYVGIEINVDFLKCHGNQDLVVLRNTLDFAVDPKNASAAGWGDLVTMPSLLGPTETSQLGTAWCDTSGCATRILESYDRHLRAEESKQGIPGWPRNRRVDSAM